jgi:hypothetical protein
LNPGTAGSPDSLRIAVHLSGLEAGASAGTFVATGLLGDSGTTGEVDRYPSLGSTGKTPLVVYGAERLAGVHGAIAIAYDGVFRAAAPGVLSGKGAWRVTGGDHAYERLDGGGLWTATARLDGPRVTVDVIYEGSGRLA